MRKFLFVVSFLFLLLLPSSVMASGFHLKTIGQLNVEGGVYTQIYYTSPDVTFTGIAPTNQTVTIDVNGNIGTTSTSSSSDWSYTTTLNEGENTVTMTTEGAEPLVFTLTIGEVPEGVGSIPAAETPVAGVGTPTLIMLALALASFASAPVIHKKLSQ